MKVLGDEKHPTIGITGGEFNLFRERLQEFEGVNTNFVNFLQSPECESTMEEKKKISIGIESGDFFFDNKNSQESIYFFMLAQQDYKRD